MKRALMLAALIVVTTPGYGNERLSHVAENISESGEIHLGLFNNGERDGFMRLGWKRDENTLKVYDRSMMPSAEVYEAYAAEMDPETLAPRSVDVRFYQGTAIMEIGMVIQQGKASGTRKVTRPGHGSETEKQSIELPDGALFRAVSFILPLFLDAEPGDTISYPWYSSMTNSINNVTLTVKDGGQVDTPAGQFDTILYELRGGAPENDIYVSMGDNPAIVRIDVSGQPLQFLATGKQ